MTDHELDELGTSLAAQDAQSKRRPSPVPEPQRETPADIPEAGEWTPEQMQRLDNLFRN